MMMRRAAGSLFSEHMWKTAFSLTVSVLGIVQEGSPPPPFHHWCHAVVKGGEEVWELSDGGVALGFFSSWHLAFLNTPVMNC